MMVDSESLHNPASGILHAAWRCIIVVRDVADTLNRGFILQSI
jgi:hypothetical protein